MEIGIAYDLKSDFATGAGDPEDRLEEYDGERTIDAIADVLASLGHRPTRLGGGRRLAERLLERPVDLVFNIAEGWGTRSREAHVPAFCEMVGVPYTHSDPLTCALTLDKPLAKRVVASHGVPTPRFAVVSSASEAASLDLAFPVIAKPSCEGSSMGIRKTSRVDDRETLARRVERLLADYRQPILVEDFMTGPEYTVGIIGNGDGARPIGVMEVRPLLAPVDEFVYSLEVKHEWVGVVDYFVPPPRLSPQELLDVERIALGAYRALGCRDIGRIDLRCDAAGRAHFIEANPLPGVAPSWGDIVICAEKAGLPYKGLIEAIVGAAARRLRLPCG